MSVWGTPLLGTMSLMGQRNWTDAMGNREPSELTEVGTVDYADATEAEGMVVISMGAPWCGPWRAFLPVLTEVAASFAQDAVSFLTCDLEANSAIALLENVTRIPTVIVYRDGRRVGTHVGMMSADDLILLVSQMRADAVEGGER